MRQTTHLIAFLTLSFLSGCAAGTAIGVADIIGAGCLFYESYRETMPDTAPNGAWNAWVDRLDVGMLASCR